MLRNYIKIALRSLMRNKAYTTINVAGLAVGLAAALLIFLVVSYESSFDTFHPKKDRIYRVLSVSKTPEKVNMDSGVPFPTSGGLRLDYPQLPLVASCMKDEGQITIPAEGKNEPKKFREDVYFAEPQFFKLFNFPWLVGNPATALSAPGSVALTQAMAERFFGNWKNAIGKSFTLDNANTFKVTGIIKDIPDNTDLPIGIILSYASLKDCGYGGNLQDWVSVYGNHSCFVELPEGMPAATFDANLAQFVKKHKPAQYAKEGMQLQPLSDMHFNDELDIYSGHPFSKNLINTLLVIGAFLLVIACVNFVNLATAQAVNRAKEVGVRKVLGSSRWQLVNQFLGETTIISLCAFLLAIGITVAALPFFNNLLHTKISVSALVTPQTIVTVLFMVLAIILLAGFYPAIVLSGFNPVTALKNKLATKVVGGVSLRRGLVVFQFIIAQILIIGTLVIVSQMRYFRNASLGYSREAIINVPLPTDSISRAKFKSFGNELQQQHGVKEISFGFASPTDNANWGSDFTYNNAIKHTDFEANLKWSDANYFKFFDMKIVAGRTYNAADTITGYVVNETLVNKLGIKPADAVGKYIGLWDDKTKRAPIIGVVKDFNVRSLREAIPAVIMASWSYRYRCVNVKLTGGDVKGTLAAVEKLWNRNFSQYLYRYQFLDDKLARLYRHEDQLSQLYKLFAGIAIFISCLGLYGLVSFMAVQRTKEVGIRRTLGASVANIIYLFSREFTVLVIIAFAVSAPVAWYFMQQWLQEYTFRIKLGPEIFLLAIAGSVVIAWLTVGYKAVSAALANPVKSLRSE